MTALIAAGDDRHPPVGQHDVRAAIERPAAVVGLRLEPGLADDPRARVPAERVLADRFNVDGEEIVGHHTYAIAGDGCMMEGITHEACSFAGTHGLGKLIVLYDDNHISIEGGT